MRYLFPPRWTDAVSSKKRDDEATAADGGTGGDDDSPRSAAAAPECYACTQPGVPAFHSTTCDRAHSPEWAAGAGSSLLPVHLQSRPCALPQRAAARAQSRWVFGPVLDPRTKRVQWWNRWVLLGRAAAVAVDPLFLYALSVGRGGKPCLYLDSELAAAAAALRTCVDAAHLVHVWVQLRLAYVSRESLVVGSGKLVWNARAVAAHYAHSPKGLLFDLFVLLPVPQVVFCRVLPRLISEEEMQLITTIIPLIFMLQFLPKMYHGLCIMSKMQKVTGYIFGTIWWGFGLNLIAYFIVSHVVGGCWYVLAIQRVASCLRKQCATDGVCPPMSLACSGDLSSSAGLLNNSVCLTREGPFPYGIYGSALPVVSSDSLAVKILYPIFWGLMTLSTFGNDLEPTSNWLEVMFSIATVLGGLMLFTLLIGNIQVFLHAVIARKRKMQLRFRDMEWWMRRRQLPAQLRQRVRSFERQKWANITEEEETEIIKDFPDGLRRDIKRCLCLDLMKKVPLFHGLDDLILDNICDRLKPLVYSRGEKVIREGDPVQRMVFVLRGRLKSKQALSKGTVATAALGAGSFLGDELLSWCLRRPFTDRLPASSATFHCVQAVQAFGLDSGDLRFVVEHFRYSFGSERLKRRARYYSSNWRTWAAVNIQLAWRRYKAGGSSAAAGEIGRRQCHGVNATDPRLRHCAAMFMSLRPHDHLE